MAKNGYVIELSSFGDFLKKLGDDIWRSVPDTTQATVFKTEDEASEYLFEMSIRSIWPAAKIRSI